MVKRFSFSSATKNYETFKDLGKRRVQLHSGMGLFILKKLFLPQDFLKI